MTEITEQKWKTNADGNLVSNNTTIHLPITIVGKAVLSGKENSINIFRCNKRKTSMTVAFKDFTKFGDRIIREADALAGKKVRITIEVLEE